MKLKTDLILTNSRIKLLLKSIRMTKMKITQFKRYRRKNLKQI
jgi:hypothetical protein